MPFGNGVHACPGNELTKLEILVLIHHLVTKYRGNILLSRKDSATLQFNLEGKSFHVRTFGLWISIIDFTLSRINTGEDILFLDLSSDPELFEGPKGDKQADTYRKIKEATEDYWEERSFTG